MGVMVDLEAHCLCPATISWGCSDLGIKITFTRDSGTVVFEMPLHGSHM